MKLFWRCDQTDSSCRLNRGHASLCVCGVLPVLPAAHLTQQHVKQFEFQSGFFFSVVGLNIISRNCWLWSSSRFSGPHRAAQTSGSGVRKLWLCLSRVCVHILFVIFIFNLHVNYMFISYTHTHTPHFSEKCQHHLVWSRCCCFIVCLQDSVWVKRRGHLCRTWAQNNFPQNPRCSCGVFTQVGVLWLPGAQSDPPGCDASAVGEPRGSSADRSLSGVEHVEQSGWPWWRREINSRWVWWFLVPSDCPSCRFGS